MQTPCKTSAYANVMHNANVMHMPRPYAPPPAARTPWVAPSNVTSPSSSTYIHIHQQQHHHNHPPPTAAPQAATHSPQSMNSPSTTTSAPPLGCPAYAWGTAPALARGIHSVVLGRAAALCCQWRVARASCKLPCTDNVVQGLPH